jgi:hypothetical protein
MAISSDEVLIQAIDHSIRREILQLLRVGDSPKSFTDLLNHFDIATSKLNYHLKLLEGFIEKTSDGKYTLTSLGQRANNVMELIRKEMSNVNQSDQPLVKNAYIAQKKTNSNFIVNFVEMGIVGVCMVIAFWIIMLIATFFDPSTPVFIYFILVGLIVAFLFFLRYLLETKRSANEFVQRIEDHLVNAQPRA